MLHQWSSIAELDCLFERAGLRLWLDMGITRLDTREQRGFTIVEVVAILLVVGILITILITTLNPGQSRETAYETAADTSLKNIANSVNLYVFKSNTYPPDAFLGLPSQLQSYVAPDDRGNWPPLPSWPNSYYDYEYWQINPASSGPDTVQISIRFCGWGASASTCAAQAPKATWAASFNSSGNAYYYCMKGYCRPSGAGGSVTYPGYCINCNTANHAGIKYPGEP